MRVLLTGAFGNIGRETLRELLHAGHEVRCFDLATPRAQQAAAELAGRAEIVWGDITTAEDVTRAVADREAVIHDAAIIPPRSEQEPELTRRVNVEGTGLLLKACEAQERKPRLVFASSMSLFGPAQGRPPPRRADDPVVPTDHYSHSKAECEEMLRASGLDWVILRLGGAPPDEPEPGTRLDLTQFFRIDPATRFEYVHPSDVGLAQTRAIACDAASHRVLLIGGGKRCQITMRDLHDVFLDAAGIGAFPDSAYGDEGYYTDWLDTEESQRLLQYQRHDFESFREAMRRRLRRVRPVVRLLRWPIRRLMLRRSPTRGR
jgi:nucleoside-diphosphate-sugar epimerase